LESTDLRQDERGPDLNAQNFLFQRYILCNIFMKIQSVVFYNYEVANRPTEKWQVKQNLLGEGNFILVGICHKCATVLLQLSRQDTHRMTDSQTLICLALNIVGLW